MQMPKMLVLAVTTIVLTGCGLEGVDASSRVEKSFNKTVTLRNGARLSLHNVNGNVQIRAWDEEKVEINAVLYASTQEKLDSMSVGVKELSNELEIRTLRSGENEGGMLNWKNWGNSGAKYTLRVPRRLTAVRVSSTNGNQEISGLESRVEAHTTNGRVALEDVRGAVTAESTNGTLDLRLRDSGDEPLRASTTNGKILVELRRSPKTSIHLSTTNGGIDVALPEGTGMQVDASTTNGNIHCDHAVKSETSSRRRLKGTMGSGGPRLELETTNGSISIQRLPTV